MQETELYRWESVDEKEEETIEELNEEKESSD